MSIALTVTVAFAYFISRRILPIKFVRMVHRHIPDKGGEAIGPRLIRIDKRS